MFDHPAFQGHESVHLFHDAETGLRAVIAVHSTARGPAAGGCRMWNYATGEEAFRDALRLSQGMSFKNAMADLPLGGGKAVVWGDSRKDKTPEMFQALGRAIDSLNGKYWTAEDVGVSPADMEEVAKQTRFVAGLDQGAAASGDPSPATARGVYLGIREALARVYGSDDPSGRTIAVQGVGHVGGGVCRLLAEAGAHLVVTDVNQAALEEVAQATGAKVVAPEDIYDVEADVFSPNALGAVINPETIGRLRCRIVAGAANNQLSTPDMGDVLAQNGVLYAPDYVINGGGIINVAAEISGNYDPAWVESKLQTLRKTLGLVLDEAIRAQRPSNRVADEMAALRLREFG